MTVKTTDGFPFHGIPEMIYTDNGPIAKSHVFQNVMDCLRINLVTHMPALKDGRRVTARSKGKVERPFRTVKEAHETLYHFHEPESDVEACFVVTPIFIALQRQTTPHRTAFADRRLVAKYTKIWLTVDVQLGAILYLCPRATTEESGNGC
jgi:hypothetical protein